MFKTINGNDWMEQGREPKPLDYNQTGQHVSIQFQGFICFIHVSKSIISIKISFSQCVLLKEEILTFPRFGGFKEGDCWRTHIS